MTNNLPDRIELRQRMFILSRSQRRILWLVGAMALILVVFLLVIATLKLDASGRDWADAYTILREKLALKPVEGILQILTFVVLLVQAVYIRRAQSHERLILTKSGIEYQSPLPSWAQRIRPGWSLRWEQIRSASLQKSVLGRGPQSLALVLEGGEKPRKIIPFLWVDPRQYENESPLDEWRMLIRGGQAAIEAAIDNSPLMRYIDVAVSREKIDRSAFQEAAAFALEGHPRTRIAIGIFLFFGLYALLDGFFIGNEVYADTPFYTVYILTGLLVALAVALWLSLGNVPLLESVILALLLGVSAGAAAYPGALRVNALTDSTGLQEYEYSLAADRTYRPAISGLPTLSFSHYPEYWAQFDIGSQYRFRLRKGGLGFYQLDMKPINVAMREFFAVDNQK
jgi:hypothetical protein